MKKLSLLLLVACAAFFVACGDDDENPIIKSSAADITAITFDSEHVVLQPVVGEGNELTLYVEAGSEENLKEVAVTITVSEGATVSPASGSKVDLSGGSAEFTVTAEDGETTKKYVVKVSSRMLFDMEEWVVEKPLDEGDLYAPAPKNFWGTSNHGAVLATAFAGLELASAVTQSQKEDAYTGNSAAKIETFDTKGVDYGGYGKIPKVTSGSLFTGLFEVDMSNTLKSTKFGVHYAKKPLSVKGYYKYKSGKTYYECSDPQNKPFETIENPALEDKDQFIISAYLYEYDKNKFEEDEASGENPYSTYLTGVDIKTEKERIVAKAEISGGNQDQYKKFELNLEYKKDYDPTKSYRLAIIMSSSAEGDKFSGAPGSVLYVDDIEIISE